MQRRGGPQMGITGEGGAWTKSKRGMAVIGSLKEDGVTPQIEFGVVNMEHMAQEIRIRKGMMRMKQSL